MPTPSSNASRPDTPPSWATTINGLVDALYAAVSFGPDEQGDWDRVREIFLPGAIFIQPFKDEVGPTVLDIDGFIDDFQQFIANSRAGAEGFHERIAARRTQVFGKIAYVSVVFEPSYGDGTAEPAGRGVDMIQLIRADDRWWIASIVTQFEREDTPMPALFLEEDVPGD
jgi:hypothetical protein